MYYSKERREILISEVDSVLAGKLRIKKDLNLLVSDLFKSHIHDAESRRLYIKGFDLKEFKARSFDTPFKTRWSAHYRRQVLAKLYKLDGWYQSVNRPPVTMMTMTCRQRGLTHPEQFRLLLDGKKKLLDLIRKDHDCEYFWILEPHTKNGTGMMHCHVALFADISDQDQERYQALWNEKYELGGFKDALDFSKRKVNRVDSIRNYLMKYLSKSLIVEKMSQGELIFNSWVWFMSLHSTAGGGIRSWGCSRLLSKEMAYDKRSSFIVASVYVWSDLDYYPVFINESFDDEMKDIRRFYSGIVDFNP